MSLPFSPASERNREPILAAMAPRLAEAGRLLEIGAGTGQHAVFMASALRGWQWLPTDRAAVLDTLGQRLHAEATENVATARALDVLSDTWPEGPFDAAYSANTAHIMSWEAVCAMLAGVARVLRSGGRFFLYGPFNVGGQFTAPSNRTFDTSLRRRDPAMGLRDLEALESEAGRHQMILTEHVAMPANNALLVFDKENGTDD